MRPNLGGVLMALMLVTAGVGMMRAISPPWPLWLVVAAGAVIGLLVFIGLVRLQRSL